MRRTRSSRKRSSRRSKRTVNRSSRRTTKSRAHVYRGIKITIKTIHGSLYKFSSVNFSNGLLGFSTSRISPISNLLTEARRRIDSQLDYELLSDQ